MELRDQGKARRFGDRETVSDLEPWEQGPKRHKEHQVRRCRKAAAYMSGAGQIACPTDGNLHPMKRYTITSVLLALVALILFVYPQQFSQSGGVRGQKRPARKPATPAPSGPGAKDYSKFSHSTKEHTE